MGRIGDAATGLRALLQLVPDSAEYRTRLAQLEPPAARHDVERSGALPTFRSIPPLETSGKRPRPSMETSAQRSLPGEPAAPIPPPPSFAPAPPVAGEAEGEFILEFEDDQLVHEPGSTGPVPSAVRRLSQPGMAAFPPPDAPAPGLVPPLAPLPPLKSLEPASGVETPPASPSFEDVGLSWPEAPRPAPRESDLEVETALPADAFQVPVEPAPLPPEAESIELAGEPLPPVDHPAPVPEPEAPAVVALAPDAIESALAEADVFRKYGLYDKAVDHLRGILKRAPDTLPLREKLFELALEGGRKNVAIAEAERLKGLYRTEGRDDRVSAIDALLVERTSAEMGEASESQPSLPAILRTTLPRARRSKDAGAPRRSPGAGGTARADRARDRASGGRASRDRFLPRAGHGGGRVGEASDARAPLPGARSARAPAVAPRRGRGRRRAAALSGTSCPRTSSPFSTPSWAGL